MTVQIAPQAPKVYIGLSTDTYPTANPSNPNALGSGAPAGAAFYATDTAVWSIFDGTAWHTHPAPNQ